MAPNPAHSLRVLKEAVKGLTYPSESDERFDVFQWNDRQATTPHEALLSHVGLTRPIEQLSLAEFFEQLEPADEAQRYHDVRRIIESVLSEPAVFRVGAGEVRVDIYLIGRLDSRTWAGLHTVSVET